MIDEDHGSYLDNFDVLVYNTVLLIVVLAELKITRYKQ